MSYEFVLVERADHIATVTMNRPDRLNALNRGLTHELHEVFDELAGEFPATRVVILSGAGRGFCSGADVQAQADALPGAARGETPPWSPFDSITALAPHMQEIPQPFVAAINGVAAGAGLSLAMAADVRVAAEGARFAAIFVKRALVPDTGLSHTLPLTVGQGVANEMALTGRLYDSQWALAKGLVNYVVAPERLLEEARQIAVEIAANPPLTVRSIKRLMHRNDRLDQVLPHEHDANTPSMNSQDRREAVMSFLEKRDPVFLGR